MRYAICQELFEGWSWAEQCRFIAEAGYTGIEVAPFTLASRITEVSAERRRELKQVAEDHGLQIIGLHWLLAKTTGLHLTTADAIVRRATTDYLRALADCCGDLGGTVLVFGSPLQRNLAAGTEYETGLGRATEIFSECAATFAARQVTLCVEPLTPRETNFLTTCVQAQHLVERVGSPWVRLHQDVKAMLSEAHEVPALIREFAGKTGHFHANDSNLLGPGMGATDFAPIIRALHESAYAGWVSVEVFDYKPGAEQIARESIAALKSAEALLK